MEMYNNILVIIVGGGTSSRSEMHIFQVCDDIVTIITTIYGLNFHYLLNEHFVYLRTEINSSHFQLKKILSYSAKVYQLFIWLKT